ncbi:MAG TPA: hypothetical protein VJ302_05365 [Blastocatellia bacterium]|nr:hypothetical protein [Blastocatellia bacterium]
MTYVSAPPDEMAAAADGGYIVRVQGLPTYADAVQLSNAVREHRRLQTVIEPIPSDQSYLIKIGPMAKLDAAKTLTNELQNSGYSLIKIMENCQPGSDCDPTQSAGQRK